MRTNTRTHTDGWNKDRRSKPPSTQYQKFRHKEIVFFMLLQFHVTYSSLVSLHCIVQNALEVPGAATTVCLLDRQVNSRMTR